MPTDKEYRQEMYRKGFTLPLTRRQFWILSVSSFVVTFVVMSWVFSLVAPEDSGVLVAWIAPTICALISGATTPVSVNYNRKDLHADHQPL